LVKKDINPKVEDVFYNYIDVTSMTRSQIGWAFRATKEFHVFTLQDFINVFSPPDFAVLDLNCGIGTCIHPSLIIFDYKLILQFDLSLTSIFDGPYRE
jgi:hypothetical protein